MRGGVVVLVVVGLGALQLAHEKRRDMATGGAERSYQEVLGCDPNATVHVIAACRDACEMCRPEMRPAITSGLVQHMTYCDPESSGMCVETWVPPDGGAP